MLPLLDFPLERVADRIVWSKGERSKRLNVFGADSVEEGGIISTDTECFERVVGTGGCGERGEVDEEGMGGEAVGRVRRTVGEGEFVFTATMRVETVWSGLETAEAIVADTAAAAAMWCSCDDESVRVCVTECEQEQVEGSKRGQRGGWEIETQW